MAKELDYWETAGHCTKCGMGFPPIREIAEKYFELGLLPCDNCSSNEDPWLCALGGWRDFHALPWALTGIGVKYATRPVVLRPKETQEVNLIELGVPPQGIVVYIVLAQSLKGVEIVAVHDSLVRPASAAAKVTLYAKPPEKGVRVKYCSVTLGFGWMEPAEDIVAASYLADAVEALARHYTVRRTADGDGVNAAVTEFLIRRVLLPTAAAVEIHLDRFLGIFLRRFSSSGAAARCLRNLAGPDKSEVILSFAVEWLRAPPIPGEIIEVITSMRMARNKAVHEGMTKVVADSVLLARWVTAAVFFIEYINFLERRFGIRAES